MKNISLLPFKVLILKQCWPINFYQVVASTFYSVVTAHVKKLSGKSVEKLTLVINKLLFLVCIVTIDPVDILLEWGIRAAEN